MENKWGKLVNGIVLLIIVCNCFFEYTNIYSNELPLNSSKIFNSLPRLKRVYRAKIKIFNSLSLFLHLSPSLSLPLSYSYIFIMKNNFIINMMPDHTSCDKPWPSSPPQPWQTGYYHFLVVSPIYSDIFSACCAVNLLFVRAALLWLAYVVLLCVWTNHHIKHSIQCMPSTCSCIAHSQKHVWLSGSIQNIVCVWTKYRKKIYV